MARSKQIRITQNDRKEYARLVKNSKSKIARTKKKYGIDLTENVEFKPIESFTSREEFNKWKQKTSSFTNRNNLNFQFVKNDYDVVASKKEINEIERNTKKAQRVADKLSKEARNKPFISGGVKQGTVGQQMLQMGKPNTAGIVRPPDFDFKKIRHKDQLKQKKENMEKRSKPDYFDKRMEKMKENFMEILSLSFNSDADNLIEKLKDVNASDFYEMYLMFDEFDFDLYASDNEGGFADSDNIYQMEMYVDKYKKGEINFDLKNFPNR